LGGERGESGPSWRWDDLGLIHGWGSVQYVGQGRRWGEMGWGEGRAMAPYFYGLNTYSPIFLRKCPFSESFPTFSRLGSNISMIIYNLFKYNCEMLYRKETKA
jgi:hypothetical protein